jgi:hypothetical protein
LEEVYFLPYVEILLAHLASIPSPNYEKLKEDEVA